MAPLAMACNLNTEKGGAEVADSGGRAAPVPSVPACVTSGCLHHRYRLCGVTTHFNARLPEIFGIANTASLQTCQRRNRLD